MPRPHAERPSHHAARCPLPSPSPPPHAACQGTGTTPPYYAPKGFRTRTPHLRVSWYFNHNIPMTQPLPHLSKPGLVQDAGSGVDGQDDHQGGHIDPGPLDNGPR